MAPTPMVLSTVADAIGDAVERWRDCDAHVRELHARLSRCPGGDAGLWAELEAEVARRDALAQALGQALGRWTALGGTLELVDPTGSVDRVAGPDAAPLVAAVEAAPEEAEGAPLAVESPAHDAAAPAHDTAAPPAPTTGVVGGPSAEGPPRVPASPAVLQRFARVGVGGALRIEEARQRTRAERHLDEVRKLLRRPLEPSQVQRAVQWVETIHLVDPLSEARLHAVGTALAARLRSLQARHPHPSIDAMFPALRAWTGRRRPGFVHGLSLDHAPTSGTWDADAEAALAALGPTSRPTDAARAQLALDALSAELDTLTPEALRGAVVATITSGVSPEDVRLLRMVEHRYDDLKGDKQLSRVRKALRAEIRQPGGPRSAPKDAPPHDWPFWHLTRGKTAVIVGGDPRAANRDRIRQAFGFARVDWPEHDATLLGRLADRAASGSVDVFLFNRFGGHVMDDIVLAPIRGDLSRWVRIDRGYGVRGVRQAMEQHWAALAAQETAVG